MRSVLFKLVAAILLLQGATSAGERPENVVVHGSSSGRAKLIVAHAERVRSDAFEQLLGEDAPRPWLERCAIHVHATPDSFANAVGVHPDHARGATSLEFSGTRVVSRRIDVMGDGAEVVPDALAHELVHVVLADHFVHTAPPRWADEGLALLFDASDKQQRHEADFRSAQRNGQALSTAELLAEEEYPDSPRRQRVFYGQSAALVRWLINRRDAATFIRFVDDMESSGVAPALKRHYDLDSVALLDSAWKEVPPIQTLTFVNQK